jgi:hypothetical protein
LLNPTSIAFGLLAALLAIPFLRTIHKPKPPIAEYGSQENVPVLHPDKGILFGVWSVPYDSECHSDYREIEPTLQPHQQDTDRQNQKRER